MWNSPKLVAVSGPLRGSTFEFGEEDVAIGRIAGSAIVIDHKSVSRHHCVFHNDGVSFRATFSAGLAMLSDAFAGVEEWIAAADAALYRAKANGRNRVELA